MEPPPGIGPGHPLDTTDEDISEHVYMSAGGQAPCLHTVSENTCCYNVSLTVYGGINGAGSGSRTRMEKYPHGSGPCAYTSSAIPAN